jgi:hypothetical protein
MDLLNVKQNKRSQSQGLSEEKWDKARQSLIPQQQKHHATIQSGKL